MHFSLLLIMLFLCGCGQTGPLYLPSQDQQHSQGHHGSL